MPSMLAIISKAVFDASWKTTPLGAVVPIETYASKNKALAPLADDGALFLVTVRPPETLVLVAILEAPWFEGEQWFGKPNRTAMTDLTPIAKQLVFETGTGINMTVALGSALQTPRRLTAADVALLRATAKDGDGLALRNLRSRTSRDHETGEGRINLRGGNATLAKAAQATAAPAASDAAPEASTANADPAPTKAASPATAGVTSASAAKDATPTGAASATAMVGSTLADVAAQLEAGQRLTALETALALWRQTPSVELAELVEELAAKLDASLPELDPEDDDFHGQWIAIAAGRQSIDVGRLMASVGEGTLAMLKKRFELLASFPRDPRIALAPLDIIAAYTSFGAEPTYTAAFALATKMGDGRANALLARLVKKAPGFAIGGDAGAKRIRKAEKARAALAPPPDLPAADAKPLAALRKQIAALDRISEAELRASGPSKAPSSKRGDELLAAVLAAPDDDAPRAVYGDWLLEQDDPRGELITQQLSAAPNEKRVRELLKQHVVDWIRPLDIVVRPESIKFARGFLDSCIVQIDTPEQRQAVLGHPLWSTVREIDCTDQDLLVDPVMRSMRRATLDGRGLSRLAVRKTPVLVDTVIGHFRIASGVRLWTGLDKMDDKIAWKPALDIGALQHLKTIYLSPRYGEALDWFMTSKLVRQLTTLDLSSLSWTIGVARWVEWANELPKLQRLVVRQTENNPNEYGRGALATVIFDRAKKGWRVTVQVNVHDDVTLGGNLERSLARLPKRSFEHVRLEYVGGDRYDPARMVELRATLEQLLGEVELATERGAAHLA